MLVTLPERLADLLEGQGSFRSLPLPFHTPGFVIKQHWHERYHYEPGNRWLRRTISDLLSDTTADDIGAGKKK
ncbi:MAG: hypothetical protein V4632_03235 [Pseudomonadota bacterium]